jgi:hypothetical protein
MNQRILWICTKMHKIQNSPITQVSTKSKCQGMKHCSAQLKKDLNRECERSKGCTVVSSVYIKKAEYECGDESERAGTDMHPLFKSNRSWLSTHKFFIKSLHQLATGWMQRMRPARRTRFVPLPARPFVANILLLLNRWHIILFQLSN